MSPTVTRQADPQLIDDARRAFAAGDLASTERMCSAALARSPGSSGAWALLTETAIIRGRIDAAMVCANRAIEIAPSDPIGHILRAKCLYLSGEARPALHAAEVASEMIDSTPEALDAVGAIFGLLGRHDRAKEFFQRAVTLCRDVPQYLFNLAATERMMGALADAEAHCDEAIALDRYYGLAHYLRTDLRIQSADRNHIAEMEALLDEGKLAPANEVMVRFALGKECEDLEMHDRAFSHVDAACRLQHRLMQQDHAAEIAEIDYVIKTHTRSWLSAAPQGFPAAAPVFVCGLPRTGTTLVERIIASHPETSSVGETSAFAAEMRRAGKAASSDIASVGKRYVETVTAFGVKPDVRFVDKTLQNYLYCGLIHAALPNAKIILLQRRPLDTCWAIYKAHFQGKFAFAYNQIELAEYYLAYRRLSQHWRTLLPETVLMEINYEDIVKDQLAASRRIIAFLRLPWNDDVLRFHESPTPSATASAVQVRRQIYSSSIGKWRHHAERLSPLRSRLAAEIPEQELA